MSEKTVVLRVEVSEDFRTRLKSQAVRSGLTMGQMIETFMNERLTELEIEAVQKTKSKAK
jgi:hypothetical protein